MDAEVLTGGTVADSRRPAPQDHGAVAQDTRERILDVALDLFIEKGYDKTSLREIAEKIGFTKAALYYHFPSKQDILMALHYRMHGLLEESIVSLGGFSSDPRGWPAVFDSLLDKTLANRKLFLMHERNRAAFEGMHQEDHHQNSHNDLEVEFRRILKDPDISLRDKVRFTCAQSALLGGLLITSAIDMPASSLDELADLLRESVHAVLGQPPGA
jgi:AcrR family transcriptional regulator